MSTCSLQLTRISSPGKSKKSEFFHLGFAALTHECTMSSGCVALWSTDAPVTGDIDFSVPCHSEAVTTIPDLNS